MLGNKTMKESKSRSCCCHKQQGSAPQKAPWWLQRFNFNKRNSESGAHFKYKDFILSYTPLFGQGCFKQLGRAS